ncbi:universal stress protein [Leifsonia poae]|uniref:Universal stress protein n=1 Tax=Leifsonia poae TaxID=110933 RepID=A0A9W6HAV6_9MICO|nr:universal stress protein [Leifsonia poae]GLJ76527.1 universal stress protein [Leifsonia poae]
MTERTVVCWNATMAADAALAWAVERESGRNGTITIIDVVDSGVYLGDVEALDPVYEAQEQERLDVRIAQLRITAPQLAVRSSVLVADPLDALFAETSPRTLVVVGTERRTGPRARFGWSFGARLAAAANGPVAIVPATDPDEPRRVGIVVGIDGTSVGDHALEFAAREASRRGEPLTIVHAWLEPLAWQPTAVPDDDFVESTDRARRELLDDRVRTVGRRHAGLTIESVLVHGEPVIALREAGRTATAVVVGSRRLGRWRRAWLGSVSHGVILELVSPVIVVGPEGEHHD